MKKTNLFLAVILALTPFTPAYAFFSPISLSIVPPVQFPTDEFTITGLRLSLGYGVMRDIYGLDVGVIGNFTTQTFTGLAVSGLFNSTNGTTTILGLQLAGAFNHNASKTLVVGIQAAIGLNKNTAEATIAGLQLAAVNQSPNTTVYGFQLGLYNEARTINGFQIGVVNRCTNLSGVQIGLVNFNETGLFKVSPILNIGF